MSACSDAGFGEDANHVLVQRHDRERVLIAAEAIDRVGEVELQVQGAFGCGHHLELFAGFNHPLALLAVAYDIGFERVGPVVFAIA